MSNWVIRNEQMNDYKKVEEIHRNAFWNVYVPGCSEHYLAHILRGHEDFVPELDYVYELDGQVVANIMYSRSKLADEQGNMTEILTFGPIGVEPEFQRRGIGKALIERTVEEAARMEYPAIVITGNPANYAARGFRSCKRYHVCMEGDLFPAAMLVKELKKGFFDGRKHYFYESPVFEIKESDVEMFDKNFGYKEKAFQYSQEEFYILSHSVIQ